MMCVVHLGRKLSRVCVLRDVRCSQCIENNAPPAPAGRYKKEKVAHTSPVFRFFAARVNVGEELRQLVRCWPTHGRTGQRSPAMLLGRLCDCFCPSLRGL